MTDEDYIRQAVELADGWVSELVGRGASIDRYDEGEETILPKDSGVWWNLSGMPQFVIDALAAQLVRQVDALPVGKFPDDAPTDIYILNGSTDIWHKKRLHAQAKGPDRTMNNIKAIVDSGVLDHARAALKAQDSEVEK